MGVGFALGAGFFNRGVQIQDENRQRQAEDRRFYMQNWMQNTLPQIKAQRAQEEQGVSLMNDIIATQPRAKENPELAYVAAKGILKGMYKTPSEFFDAYEKDPTIAPPEVYQAQVDALSKTFAFDTDPATGKVAGNFRMKPQEQQEYQPMPGAQKKRSLAEILTGKKSQMAVAEGARQDTMAATGVDPVQDTLTNRFASAPTSGKVSLTPVDKRQRELEEMAVKGAIQSGDVVNMKEFFSQLTKGGPTAALSAAKWDTIDAKEKRKVQAVLNGEVARAVIQAGEETGNKDFFDVLSDFSVPDALNALKKNAKTPEEKAAQERRIKEAKGDFPDFVTNSTAMAFIASDPSYLEARGYSKEESKRHSDTAKKAIKTLEDLRMDPTKAYMARKVEQMTADTANAEPTTLGPAGQQPGSAAQADSEETPIAPTNNVVKPQVGKRTGDTASGRSSDPDTKFMNLVKEGSTQDIETANPLTALKAMSRQYTTLKSPKESAAALRFTEADKEELRSTKELRDMLSNLAKAGALPTYRDIETATQEAPVGSVFLIEGDPSPKFMFEHMKQ